MLSFCYNILHIWIQPPPLPCLISLPAGPLSFPSPDFSVSLLFNDSFPPGLTLSVLSSLLAVSRKQMRTLRCRLRYTGLASWPGSVHHTTTTTTSSRCTEPLKHQPSVTLCRLFTLACLLPLLLTRSLSHHTPDWPFTPAWIHLTDCCCKAVAASKHAIPAHFSSAFSKWWSHVHLSFPVAAPKSQISQFSRFFSNPWLLLWPFSELTYAIVSFTAIP